MPADPVHPAQHLKGRTAASNAGAAALDQPSQPQAASCDLPGASCGRTNEEAKASPATGTCPAHEASGTKHIPFADGAQQGSSHGRAVAMAVPSRLPAQRASVQSISVLPVQIALDAAADKLLWGQQRQRSQRNRQKSPVAKLIGGELTGHQISGASEGTQGLPCLHHDESLVDMPAPLPTAHPTAAATFGEKSSCLTESSQMQTSLSLPSPVVPADTDSRFSTTIMQIRNGVRQGARSEKVDVSRLAAAAAASQPSTHQQAPPEQVSPSVAVIAEGKHAAGLTQGHGKENQIEITGCRVSTRIRKASTKHHDIVGQ